MRTINDVKAKCKCLFSGKEKGNTHRVFEARCVFYFEKKLFKFSVSDLRLIGFRTGHSL